MERTSTTQDAPRRHDRRLLAYCVGFLLLTNLLTVVFVFVLRGSAHPPAPVILERVRPEVEPGPAAHARIETRQVRVTSRPEGAVVMYQGQVQGTTPLAVDLPAHAAAALAIEKDGYRSREVTVEPGQAKVHVRLSRSRERQSGRARPASASEQASQADAPATEEPAARTPATTGSPRAGARGAASDSDTRTSDGARTSAPASPDLAAE